MQTRKGASMNKRDKDYWVKMWLYQRCKESSVDNEACDREETCKKCRYWFPLDDYNEISAEEGDDINAEW